MAGRVTPDRDAAADESRPLLSHSSILIFSGVLIGMVASQVVQARWEPFVYLAGLFGLVAWFALGHLARIREQRRASSATRQAASRLASRLDRHTLRFQASGPHSPLANGTRIGGHPGSPRHQQTRGLTGTAAPHGWQNYGQEQKPVSAWSPGPQFRR